MMGSGCKMQPLYLFFILFIKNHHSLTDRKGKQVIWALVQDAKSLTFILYSTSKIWALDWKKISEVLNAELFLF